MPAAGEVAPPPLSPSGPVPALHVQKGGKREKLPPALTLTRVRRMEATALQLLQSLLGAACWTGVCDLIFPYKNSYY